MAGTAGIDPRAAASELRRRIVAGEAVSGLAADAFLKRERGTWIWRERAPDGGFQVVKLYRHRGPACALRGRVTRFRAEREWSRLQHLVRWDLPCPAPLSWAHGRSRQHGYFDALLMREIPDAVPLDAYLRSCGYGAVLAPLFRLARRMHDSGLFHQSLYARNILVRPATPSAERFHFLDLPRSWVFPESISGSSMAWSDLLDLTCSIRLAGVPTAEIPVEAYAVDGDEPDLSRTLVDLRHAQHSFGKLARRRRDARTRLRWLTAWTMNPHRRPPTPDAGRGDVTAAPAVIRRE